MGFTQKHFLPDNYYGEEFLNRGPPPKVSEKNSYLLISYRIFTLKKFNTIRVYFSALILYK